MHYLGYDVGSSSVKACLLDGDTGRPVAAVTYPEEEMEIRAPRPGWAEQDSTLWWDCVKQATRRLLSSVPLAPGSVKAIGIAYQMHGLVLVDEKQQVLRPSIIWCDSRAVEIGRRAFQEIGEERCLARLLNSPGNFTASKLRWVRENEPEVFSRIHKMMLPGDYIAMKLTGQIRTTVSGLSEAVLWDFENATRADFLLDYYGLNADLVPEIVHTFDHQGELTRQAAEEMGLAPGTPVTYRAGDQPNNALSLNVLEPGEIAATAGTSGVVYAVSDRVKADSRSRVNGFAHVNHDASRTRLGILLCINGAGSANRWTRLLTGRVESSYAEMNALAATAPRGSQGLHFLPFGNGSERMLEDREPGAQVCNLNFNIHTPAHLLRAVQEGVAFAFKYGLDILAGIDVRPRIIRAGLANMFLSPLFRDTLAGVGGVSIELYDTDGAQGAARGAAMGAGHYRSWAEAFHGLERKEVVESDSRHQQEYQGAYDAWVSSLNRLLEQDQSRREPKR